MKGASLLQGSEDITSPSERRIDYCFPCSDTLKRSVEFKKAFLTYVEERSLHCFIRCRLSSMKVKKLDRLPKISVPR